MKRSHQPRSEMRPGDRSSLVCERIESAHVDRDESHVFSHSFVLT